MIVGDYIFDGHVSVHSDTGTVAPERCVFGIMLDVSAFLGNITFTSLSPLESSNQFEIMCISD